MLIYSKIYGLEPESRRKVIEELLELMELTDASRRLVKTYYGGMIRRLEIAITLMSRPRLLILDEPTIGLDPRARMMVWENLLAYKKESNTTIFSLLTTCMRLIITLIESHLLIRARLLLRKHQVSLKPR
jgi:ABC-2 type transport system ATP-binding protein